MQFSLYQIAARLFAAYLFVDGIRRLRLAVVERKIRYPSTNWLDFLLDWSDRVVERDESPFFYWLQFGLQIITIVGCLFVVIFGWHSAARP